MIVTSTGRTPKVKELIKVLKQEFAGHYSYKLSGFDTEPTVIVSRYWLTAAQITVHKNEIRVEQPSAIRTFISTIIRYPLGFAMPLRPWREKFQKQLVIFLKRKYD